MDVGGQVWFTIDGKPLGGHDRMALLMQVGACGSITQAAKTLGISYKHAWDAIDEMNRLAGEPLVQRASGGKGGGGTHLTARGQQLLERFAHIEQEHRHFLAKLEREMCNSLTGTVVRIGPGTGTGEVELEVAGGQRIVAIVDSGSAGELGLAVGKPACALVNASSIMLAIDDGNARYSARNRLAGTVTRITPGAVNCEVVLDIGDGATLAAIITNESVQALSLAEGAAATALFKASSVNLRS